MDSISQPLSAGAISFMMALVAGPIIIPYMKKLKIGQSIREEGPKSHMVKSGTPTMGGVIMLAGVIAASIVLRPFSWDALVIVLSFIGFGLVGFLDDYIKVVLKRNLGLKAGQKMAGLMVVSILITVMVGWKSTSILVPFTSIQWDLGLLFGPFLLFVLLGTTNSVNLTDGLDGLATGVTLIVISFFTLVAILQNNIEVAILGAALVGACAGFLKFNFYPAKIFMGDTGSLALGGAVTAMAAVLEMPLFIPLVGFIYFIEALSVMIQVASFKLFGKRVFRMSPLHHHFELGGWSERKIVFVFWSVTLVMAILSYSAFK